MEDLYWIEEFKRYKTFGTSGKNTDHKKTNYNERPIKHWKCGCGCHSRRITETFNKGVQIEAKNWYYKELPQWITRRTKNRRLLIRRRLRKNSLRNSNINGRGGTLLYQEDWNSWQRFGGKEAKNISVTTITSS